MKSFRLYLGRPGIWASRLVLILARRFKNRRLYRLAMWLAKHSSPLGVLVATSIALEAVVTLIFAEVEKMVVVPADSDSESCDNS